MGYFPNATSQDIYEAQYCRHCVHWGQGSGCPIMSLHWFWNYDAVKDAVKKEALGMFIPRSEVMNLQCTMFYRGTPPEVNNGA